MNCKQCGIELIGRRKNFCSDKCRMKSNRVKPEQIKVEHVVVKPEHVIEQFTPKQYVNCLRQGEGDYFDSGEFPAGTLAHYYTNPEMYATRVNPERLNWGGPKSFEEMKILGLIGNRVSIPGDWDYSGVCSEVDGVWKVAS